MEFIDMSASYRGCDSWSLVTKFNYIHTGPSPRILVVGDAMWDEHMICRVDGFSPESDIAPKLRVEQSLHRPGGAANVAMNLKSMAVEPILVSVRGPDPAGHDLENALTHRYNIENFLKTTNRCTTHKLRYLTKHGQQILRVDTESTDPLTQNISNQLLDYIKKLGGIGAIVVSDYGKGVVTESLVNDLVENFEGPILVDPKGTNFMKYGLVTLIKPNEKELTAAAHASPTAGFTVRELASKVERVSNWLLVTRSDHGSSLFDSNAFHSDVPVRARIHGDPTGCGDSALAALAIGMANGFDVPTAARLANAAGSVAFDHIGVHAVTRDELEAELKASERTGA